MTISRAQMRRQLYMGGGIASLEPRQQYGLGSIVKSVTKAVKGVGDAVGDIVSSDAGKLALLAAGGYYLGGGFTPGGFSWGNLPGASKIASGFNAFKNMSTLAKGATILGGSALLTSLFGSPDQAQEAFNRDPGYVKSSLAKYYKNINKDASEEEVQEFVNQNILEFGDVSRSDVVSGYEKNIKSNLEGYDYANGGRVELASGGLGNINTFSLYQQYLNELEDAQQQSISSPLYNPTVSYQTGDGDGNSNFGKQDDVQTGNLNKGAGLRERMSDMFANMREGRYNVGKGILGGAILGPLGYSRGFFSGRSHIGVDDVNAMSIGINMDAVYGDNPSPSGPGPGDPGGGSPTPGDTSGTPFAYGGRVMKGIGGLITQNK